MIWLRNGLYAGIALVAFLLFSEWNKFQEEKAERLYAEEQTIVGTPPNIVADNSIPNAPSPVTSQSAEDSEIPPVFNNTNSQEIASNIPKISNQLIEVKTDSFDILIDPSDGSIVKLALLKHKRKIDSDEPFILLNKTASNTYIAESGLIKLNGVNKELIKGPFTSTQSTYSLNEKDQLTVDLILSQESTQITKRFNFSRDSYLIDVSYIIQNKSESDWVGSLYGRIKRGDFRPTSNVGPGMSPFVGPAITTPETNYKKFSFDDIEDESYRLENKGGWVAMVQHYFMSAWIPNSEKQHLYSLRKDKNRNLYHFGFASEFFNVSPGQTETVSAQYYAGPKNIKVLEKISPYLDLTIDFSWLWFIAKPLFFGLDFIHGLVGNWGFAIILLTLCIKIVLFYPSAISFKSMAKMRKLTPKLQELKERYGDDKQKVAKETWDLYRKEKVSPVSGCLPILMQMPIFIALYWALMESVELRHAPFILWIEDLSVKDPFYFLPIFMGFTMWIQQKLNPTPPDPMQAKIMQLMPFFFTALFMFFPAGLVLYWVVNNTLSIAQQYVITRQIEKQS